MYKGVIFDLDGVLVSTDELHYLAWKRLADELGINGFNKEDNIRQRGVSRMESLEVVLQKSNKHYSEEEKLNLADIKNKYYVEMINHLDSSAVLNGAIRSLKKLNNMNIPCAIGSASRNALEIIEKTGISRYISAVSCGYDTTKTKPDPEVFLIAAKKLNLEPQECLVVEDAKAGIEAAKNGGMKSIGVGPHYNQLDADYEYLDLSFVNWDEILRNN